MAFETVATIRWSEFHRHLGVIASFLVFVNNDDISRFIAESVDELNNQAERKHLTAGDMPYFHMYGHPSRMPPVMHGQGPKYERTSDPTSTVQSIKRMTSLVAKRKADSVMSPLHVSYLIGGPDGMKCGNVGALLVHGPKYGIGTHFLVWERELTSIYLPILDVVEICAWADEKYVHRVESKELRAKFF